jgi:hypothetical protein
MHYCWKRLESNSIINMQGINNAVTIKYFLLVRVTVSSLGIKYSPLVLIIYKYLTIKYFRLA